MGVPHAARVRPVARSTCRPFPAGASARRSCRARR